MDHRVFGKEITNILDNDLNKYKRNYSFLHGERLRDHSLNLGKGIVTNRLSNKSQVVQPEKKVTEPKVQTTDPQMVPEYFFENMQFLRNREKQAYKLGNYIPTHKTVSEQSRAKLIDWLSQLHYKYKMFPETLFTIVALIDQYLSVKEVSLCDLQLVGVSALYIASKFEETYQVPQAKQLVSCCAGQYTINQIL